MVESAHIAGTDDVPHPEQLDFRLGAWELIADGVYRMVAEPASVNLGLVVGSEGALLIDTGSSPAQGADIAASIAELTDRPLLAVVVTHDHFDHAFGLAAFTDVAGIGHETLADTLRDVPNLDRARRMGVDPADLVLPQTLISVADVVELGGQRVAEIVHLGVGHSRGDLVINITDPGSDDFDGVIFAGDLIESAPSIDAGAVWYGPDSAIDEWSWTVNRLHELTGPRTIVVPGHGEPVDRDFVEQQRNAIDAVRVEILRLSSEGVREDDAAEQGDWPFPADHVAAGIGAGYAEIRAAAATDPAAGGRSTLPLA
ncbi:MBL fold metallo-hydrolase [Microlunatus soli]|uniref:Glyoxylase, beta-lactamase superfamily II n=1 Tax=Microlunatus soli TaxID=630515 RepID=A0A1H1YR89_9ACTN|nr:MBL fold metallo-hydrolase [Microlunatus soli]SDT23968.1 Glyoxylase, beta-lactamase superfamily II [Microlunatus soli]